MSSQATNTAGTSQAGASTSQVGASSSTSTAVGTGTGAGTTASSSTLTPAQERGRQELAQNTANLQPAHQFQFGAGNRPMSIASSVEPKKCLDCGAVLDEVSLACRDCLLKARDLAERIRQAARSLKPN